MVKLWGSLYKRTTGIHRLNCRWDLGRPRPVTDGCIEASLGGGETEGDIFPSSQTLPLPRLHRKTGRDSGDTPCLGMCVKWTPSSQRMHLLLLQAPTRLSLQRAEEWPSMTRKDSILSCSSFSFQTQNSLLAPTDCFEDGLCMYCPQTLSHIPGSWWSSVNVFI